MNPVRLLVCLVPAVVAVALGLRRWSFTVDDTFITLRYSWNLANGQGLTFNPGEAVEGYSNPTWTLLLALALALGAPGLGAAKALGLGAHALTCSLVTWAGLRVGDRVWPGGPWEPGRWLGPMAGGLMLAWSVPASDWAVMGLETGLYALFLTASFVALLHPAPKAVWVAAAFAGLAGISRPEGPLQAAMLGLSLVLVRSPRLSPKSLWQTGAGPAVVVCAPVFSWQAFRWFYYGDVVPNTYYHKGGGATLEEVAAYINPLLLGESVLFVAAVGGLLLTLAAQPRLGVALALLAAGHVAFVVKVGGDWMPNQRFAAPGLPVTGLAISMGLASLAAVGRREGVRAYGVGAALAALTFAALHASQSVPVRQRGTDAELMLGDRDTVMGAISRSYSGSNNVVASWVLGRVRTGEAIAYSEVGLIAFVGEFRVIDMVGLCSREMAGATGLDYAGRVEWLRGQRPEWLLVRQGGVQAIRQVRASAWLQTEYDVFPGPKNYLAARRKGVAPATVAEALANFERAIERQPGFSGFETERAALQARAAAGEGSAPAYP